MAKLKIVIFLFFYTGSEAYRSWQTEAGGRQYQPATPSSGERPLRW